jgi:DNA-binding HxlR family transcriptional regulator
MFAARAIHGRMNPPAHALITVVPAQEEDTLQALQAAVGVLAAKWSVVVLTRLESGTQRFNELLRAIDGVSRRMLSATLRQLERDGLVDRRVYPRVPARVEYDLSPAGRRLLEALAPLAGWGMAHRGQVNDARERFDRMQAWRTKSETLQGSAQVTRNPIV